MDSSPTPMLFCPPLPPVRLDTTLTVVIGRHSECGLAVRDANVSRRHAQVRHTDAGFVIEDLGSTNGTFVNGEALCEPRRLEAGDRIEISDCTITFCCIQGDVDGLSPPDGEKTLLFQRPSSGKALEGELAEIPTFALCQVLEMGNKSGMLAVEGENGSGHIWFASGQPVHAETEKATGVEAALEILCADRGRFRFHPAETATTISIEASVTHLLLEASRLQDERTPR